MNRDIHAVSCSAGCIPCSSKMNPRATSLGEKVTDHVLAGWGYIAGVWHDLGKYAKEFQQRIKSISGYDADTHREGTVGRVDHSPVGASYAVEQFGVHGRILAYLIVGHHAGLPDWHSGETGGAALNVRLGEKSHLARALGQAIPQKILAQTKPTSSPVGQADGFALWVRMLFSCLVDADFLDTEALYVQKFLRRA